MKTSEALALMPGYYKVDEVRSLDNVVLTIKELTCRKIKEEDEDESPLLSFEGTKKLLILNKTRMQQLTDLHGPGDPAGAKVRLSVDTIAINNRKFEMIVILEV